MSCPEKLPDEVRVKFNPSSQDDQILMGILASDYPKENVGVVSYDNPILIKAKAHGLCFLRMPDEFLLKWELSEEEKELERCKKEIAAYKNRISKLVLLLNKEKVCLKIKRSPILDIEKELAKHMSGSPRFTCRRRFMKAYHRLSLRLCQLESPLLQAM